MRASALAAFVSFTSRFEGSLPYMYLDVKGLVTTGIGNLIDPIGLAMPLSWLRKDGSIAQDAEIVAEWRHIKSAQALARLGGGAFAQLATLHLAPESVTMLVQGRLAVNETYLARRWPGYPMWPADAQLACASCAWAAGPAWHAPRLDAALALPDFDVAAGPPGDAATRPECRGEAWLNDTGNQGLRPRNLANKLLFENAACVQSLSAMYDPDVLYYPGRLSR